MLGRLEIALDIRTSSVGCANALVGRELTITDHEIEPGSRGWR